MVVKHQNQLKQIKKMQSQKKLTQMLKDFAISQPKINAVYQGHSPEDENHNIYYFLIDTHFDSEFTDRVSDLSFKISDADLSEWPCTIEQADNYPFLGKCIWKRLNPKP